MYIGDLTQDDSGESNASIRNPNLICPAAHFMVSPSSSIFIDPFSRRSSDYIYSQKLYLQLSYTLCQHVMHICLHKYILENTHIHTGTCIYIYVCSTGDYEQIQEPGVSASKFGDDGTAGIGSS